MSYNKISNHIKGIIEKKLLVDTSTLASDDNLSISLGIDQEIDLPLIISGIKEKYEISHEAKSLLKQATTLNQLTNIVFEETELG